MNNPTITFERQWSSGSVRAACIRHRLYTHGDSEEYEQMLTFVDINEPTTEILYTVAKDIYDHSENQTITNIMFILEREAVYTFYYIDGSDEI